MGKTKKNRSKSSRLDPTTANTNVQGASSITPGDDGVVIGSAVRNLVQQLQSSYTEDREVACSVAANLVEDVGAIPQMLKAGIVRILGPLILDPSFTVRQAAMGALRNISVDGGEDTCIEMVNQDVMTPVRMILKQIPNLLQDASGDPDRLAVCSVSVQALHLLLNLCESSTVAVDIFKRENVIADLPPFLDVRIYKMECAIAAAQCLLTVSDNNEELCQYLRQDEVFSILKKMAGVKYEDICHLHLKVLCSGIICNCCLGQAPELSNPLLESAIHVFSTALDINANEKAQELLLAMLKAPNGSSSSKNEKELSDLHSLLTLQETSLEMLTNIATSEDSNDWEDVSSEESAGEMEVCDEEPMTSEEDCQMLSTLLSEAVTKAMENEHIVEKILRKQENLVVTDPQDSDMDAIVVRLRKKFRSLQIKSFFCLSNMADSLDIQSIGGNRSLYLVWKDVCNTAVQVVGSSEDVELLEAAVNAMRALTIKMAATNAHELTTMSAADFAFLSKLCRECSSAEVRANTIRVIGSIGLVLAKTLSQQASLQNIGDLLLNTASQDVELWVNAEALDALFDVFAEDNTDSIVKELDMLNRLQALVPTLKAKYSKERKTLGEHLPIVSTARNNILRFIQYKANRQ